MTVRFSVCISVSNGLEGLAGTVDSVLAQKHRDWELSIVDNASAQDIASLISTDNDPRIRYHRFADHLDGIEALNRACQLCTCEWVYPLRAGDLLESDCLSTMADRISAAGPNRLAAVVGRINPTLNPSPSTGREAPGPAPGGVYDASQWFGLMSKVKRAPSSLRTVAYSRDILIESGWFRPDLGDGAVLEVVLRVAAYGDVLYVDRTLIQAPVSAKSSSPDDTAPENGGMTMVEAAWDSAIRAHAARRAIAPEQLAAIKAAIARSHIQRALDHRVSSNRHSRRRALADICRAYRTRPALLASPGDVGASALALLAPRSGITAVMNFKTRREEARGDRPARM